MEESGSGAIPAKTGSTEMDFKPKFLKSENNFEKVVLCSYPRSGNSLLRGLLERITGIITGSDTDPRRKLGQDLNEFGLKGEGVTDSRVWITKTHYPERRGYASFKAEKAIILVRNPFDAIDSLWNMAITGTHTLSIQESEYNRFSQDWERYVQEEITIWKRFHEFWFSCPIPCHIIRYEDLKSHPEEALVDLFKFLMNKESVVGTKINNKITSIVSQMHLNSVYKPRVGRVYHSLKHYNEKLMRFSLEEVREELRNFGYLDNEFFDYDVTRSFKEECMLGHEGDDEIHGSKESGEGGWSSVWINHQNRESLQRVLKLYNSKDTSTAGPSTTTAILSASTVSTVSKRDYLVLNSLQGIRPKTDIDPNQRGQKRIKKKLRPLARIKVEGDEEYDEAEVKDEQ